MFISDIFIDYNFKDLPMDVESNWNNLPKKSKETILYQSERAYKRNFIAIAEAPLVYQYLPGIFVRDGEDYHWNLWQAKRSAYILTADFWIKGQRLETLIMLFYATFIEESLARGLDVVTSYFRDDPRFERTSKALAVEYTDDKKKMLFDTVDMYSYFAFLYRAVVSTKTGKDMTEFLVARLKELPGTSKWIGQISRMRHMVAKVHDSTIEPLEEAKPQKLMKLTCVANDDRFRFFDLYVYQDTLFNWVYNVVLASYRIHTHKLLTGSMSKPKPRKSIQLPYLMCYGEGKCKVFYTVTSRTKMLFELGIQDGDTVYPCYKNKPPSTTVSKDNTPPSDNNNGKGKRQKKSKKAKSKGSTKSKQEHIVNEITLREAHSKSMESILNELRPLLKIRRDKIASYYLQKLLRK